MVCKLAQKYKMARPLPNITLHVIQAADTIGIRGSRGLLRLIGYIDAEALSSNQGQ